jgi:hypothetical protein
VCGLVAVECGLMVVECGLRLRSVGNGYVKRAECLISGIIIISFFVCMSVFIAVVLVLINYSAFYAEWAAIAQSV